MLASKRPSTVAAYWPSCFRSRKVQRVRCMPHVTVPAGGPQPPLCVTFRRSAGRILRLRHAAWYLSDPRLGVTQGRRRARGVGPDRQAALLGLPCFAPLAAGSAPSACSNRPRCAEPKSVSAYTAACGTSRIAGARHMRVGLGCSVTAHRVSHISFMLLGRYPSGQARMRFTCGSCTCGQSAGLRRRPLAHLGWLSGRSSQAWKE